MTAPFTEPKATCPICGDEYLSRDVKKPASTCGRRICVTNYEYQERHYNTVTGKKPSSEQMKKW